MSLVIRLSPVGKKGERKFRVVVKEKRSKPAGGAKELLGWYHRLEKTEKKEVNKDRLAYWISQGAKPSLTVKKIFEL